MVAIFFSTFIYIFTLYSEYDDVTIETCLSPPLLLAGSQLAFLYMLLTRFVFLELDGPNPGVVSSLQGLAGGFELLF
jgi:hypothetical protein